MMRGTWYRAGTRPTYARVIILRVESESSVCLVLCVVISSTHMLLTWTTKAAFSAAALKTELFFPLIWFQWVFLRSWGTVAGRGERWSARSFWLKQSWEVKMFNNQLPGISEYPKCYFKKFSFGGNFYQPPKTLLRNSNNDVVVYAPH